MKILLLQNDKILKVFSKKIEIMSKIVAIVGRPNVGKSTLFNRLTGTRQAIVNEESGVTRDRNYGKVFWNGIEFSLIDTGGYMDNSDDVFEEEIKRQVQLAIDEADVLLLTVDVESGVTDLDMNMANMLRKIDKPVLVVVNKVDNTERTFETAEFYSLGLADELYSVSSINGSGTGELLDKITALLPEEEAVEEEEQLPRFTFVGRPNVGKSSTVNTLLGEDKTIVTPVAGTTRDSVDIHFNKFGHNFIMVDTAGVRKKGKVNEDVEFYAVMRSVRSIENSDVCILILDAERGIEAQDLNIIQLVVRNRKGLVIMVNKWDLIEKDHKTMEQFRKRILERTAPFTDIPIVFASALTKQRVLDVLQAAMRVYENRQRKVPTSKLNEVMLDAIEENQPPTHKGKFVRIKYITQLPTLAPSFAFYCNLPQYVRESYRRYLENRIRQNWDFSGVPLQLFMRKK